MIRGAHHVAISTQDMAQALFFYRDLLGFKEVSATSWSSGTDVINQVLDLPDSAAKQIMLKGSNLCIELFEFSNPAQSLLTERRPVSQVGLTHLCLDVDDIQFEYNRLLEAGIEFHVPPQDFGAVKATYGRDPDGNVFELQEIVDPCSPDRLFE
ncbi:VOC family protein [Aestuariicella sp. G3-2]|uniref:VOC family protein n=1 Tax=Pseudomaricurvus albidus TaxID=2842452 RepID=UPI001C0B5D48|nr:VOC family protein [Aestuariicella albida]MBU3071251.1 VOC family protein [Aestuariicella albida]